MRLFIIGLGYTARFFIQEYAHLFEQISATVRTSEKQQQYHTADRAVYCFDPPDYDRTLLLRLTQATHLLVSAPPSEVGDCSLPLLQALMLSNNQLQQIIYLSTTGIYGDCAGEWVDESAIPRPQTQQSHNRLKAEQQWIDFAQQHKCHLDIMRLAGIYGPGRSVIDRIKSGQAQCIIKKNQVFNRIHVQDIAGVLAAVCRYRPAHYSAPEVFNLADDLPAAGQDVIRYAAHCLRLAPPPDIRLEDAVLSPMGLSFYSENKRVNNQKIKQILGYTLRYPDYKVGLDALLGAI